MVKPLFPYERGDDRGALSLPMAIALMAIAIAGMGIWGLLRHWRHQVELQLRLDRCVGKTALDLKRSLLAIEGENAEIRRIRIALLALTLEPPAKAALESALLVEVGRQETELALWEGRRLAWLARRGCDGRGDSPVPLPGQSWQRDPPDVNGPQPLRWTLGVGKKLHIELVHLPRAAAAEVTGNRTKGAFHVDVGSDWRANWEVPGIGRFGAGLR